MAPPHLHPPPTFICTRRKYFLASHCLPGLFAALRPGFPSAPLRARSLWTCSAAVSALGLARLEPLDKLHGCHFEFWMTASCGSSACSGPETRAPSAPLPIPLAYASWTDARALCASARRAFRSAKDRGGIADRTVRVGTSTQGPPHVRFDPIDLFVPGFVKRLRGGHLVGRGRRGGGFGLSLRAAGAAPRPDLVRLRWGFPGAGGSATDGFAGAARGLGTCTARGRLQGGRMS